MALDAAPRDWPVFASLRGWQPAWLVGDLAAGVTLAAIAVPEQMATARLAGLPLASGFYAFVAGSVAVAPFGANRWMSVGADSTIAPIIAAGQLPDLFGVPKPARGVVARAAGVLGALGHADWTGFALGAAVFTVSAGLPRLRVPHVGFGQAASLAQLGAVIAIVCIMQTSAVAP